MAEDIRKMIDTSGVAAFHRSFEKPYCVLMDSEYCSMGRMIAIQAAKKAGYRYYDAVLLLEKLNDPSVDTAFMDRVEQKLSKKELTRGEMLQDPEIVKLKEAFDRAVRIVLAEGPCLIHDRTVPEEIRALGYSVFSVMNYASDDAAKIERARRSPACSDCRNEEEFAARITEQDMIRKNYHRLGSDTCWGAKENYDLCLNAETLGKEHASEVLACAVR